MPPKKAVAGAGAAKKKSAKNAYQMPEHLPPGSVLTDLFKQQWHTGPSIGTGGFGEIYSASKAGGGTAAKTKSDDHPFVVKIEPHDNGPLFVEMHFYMRNAKLDEIEKFRKEQRLAALGMPHFVASGSHELNAIKHRFVVMPRYGQDIGKLWLAAGRRLPAHTACRLALQMLDVLQYIHRCTYVHADLKGANMLLGPGRTGATQAYLVDFGLACHYSTAPTFKPDPKKMHNGTIEYTSRDAHCGVPTRRGDLEILAYNVVHWWGGAQLPWEAGRTLEQPVRVHEAKRAFMDGGERALREMFAAGGGGAGCPAPILQFFQYVNTLEFDDAPDYSKCRKIFDAGLKALGKTNSGNLDFKVTGKTVTPPAAAAVSPKKPTRKPAAKTKATPSSSSDEIITPVPAATLKRTARKAAATPVTPKRTKPKRATTPASESDAESDPEVLPAKRTRTARTQERENATNGTATTTNGTNGRHNRSAGAASPTASTGGGSMTVNNDILSKGHRKKEKTYEFNFELDVSLDANVVINVKRKPRKEKDATTPVGRSPTTKKASTPLQKVLSATVTAAKAKAAAASSHSESLHMNGDDDDEIEASPDVTPVASMRRLQKDDSRRLKAGGTPTTTGRK